MKYLLLISLTICLYHCTFRNQGDSSKIEIPEHTILNLYDAFSKESNLTKDFGFSCITKYQGKTILFDAGSNADILKKNAEVLGLDLGQIDIVIVSHGHFDHLNGLDYVLSVNPRVKIYFPYDIFWGAPVPFDATGQDTTTVDSLPSHMQYFDGGATKFMINQSGRFWHADIEFVKSSKDIFPGAKLITTSSEYMGYFSCYPNKSFVEGQFEESMHDCRNTGLPELSLSLSTDQGQILIVGCSHTGVDKIIQHALNIVPGNLVEMVYGGFHMLPFNRFQTEKLASLIQDSLKVHKVAPAHCTGHLAFQILHDKYKKNYVYAGLGEKVVY